MSCNYYSLKYLTQLFKLVWVQGEIKGAKQLKWQLPKDKDIQKLLLHTHRSIYNGLNRRLATTYS